MGDARILAGLSVGPRFRLFPPRELVSCGENCGSTKPASTDMVEVSQALAEVADAWRYYRVSDKKSAAEFVYTPTGRSQYVALMAWYVVRVRRSVRLGDTTKQYV